jgi:hypothetical protein
LFSEPIEGRYEQVNKIKFLLKEIKGNISVDESSIMMKSENHLVIRKNEKTKESVPLKLIKLNCHILLSIVCIKE